MKNFTLIVYVFFACQLEAQIIDIPDSNFKQTLINLGIDTNNNNEIEESEAMAPSALSVFNQSIVSIVGIEYFTNLKTFICSNNFIDSADLSTLSLLEYVAASENLITELILPESENLRIVDLRDNRLSALNLGNLPNLESLNCAQNPIAELELQGYTNLEDLYCFKCALSNLDLRQNVELSTLATDENDFEELLLPNSDKLINFTCTNNNLTTLDLNPYVNLELLNCASNQIETLDLSSNLVLKTLFCENNLIQNLDCSYSSEYTTIDCKKNDIKRLNIKNGSDEMVLDFTENPNLNFICADASQIPTVTLLATNSGYPSMNVSADCSTTVSSDQVEELESEISIMPNPASSSAVINSKKGFLNIWIRSLQGKILESFDFEQTIFQYELDFNLYPSQLYIISLKQGEKIIHYKLLKQ